MCASPVLKHAAANDVAMTEPEWRMRVDLAACYRLIAHYDMDDLFATHISARVPGKEEHFLINPYGVHFSEVTASNLVKVNLDGEIIDETDHVINPAGFVIHSAIHGARPDAKCVLHTHTVAGMAIATMEDGLKPIFQKATRYYKRLAYHDFEGKAQDLDERARLVRDLGDRNYLVLRNHGLLVCAPTIGQAFKEMYAMEKACKTQLAVMAAGGKLVPLSESLLEHTARQFENDAKVTKERPSGWESLKKMLDRVSPGYDC
ncbi:MAG: class II aldolase/adducin family protein [Alphaproteobacteria bacterium]|nr:class II aldolase/adducin family protein [Alphaproteobacteria bacterium]